MPKPTKKFEKQNNIKKKFITEKAANKPAKDVIIHPIIKPNLRPILLIKNAANIEPNEVPTIIKATGKVANVLTLVIDEPTIPLKKTVIGAAVKENT